MADDLNLRRYDIQLLRANFADLYKWLAVMGAVAMLSSNIMDHLHARQQVGQGLATTLLACVGWNLNGFIFFTLIIGTEQGLGLNLLYPNRLFEH